MTALIVMCKDCVRTKETERKWRLLPSPALWSHLPESNREPSAYRAVALPIELRWHVNADVRASAFSFERDHYGIFW